MVLLEFVSPVGSSLVKNGCMKYPTLPVASNVKPKSYNSLRIYLSTFLVVLIDQATKMWIKQNYSLWETREIIGSFLRISYVKNPGIAFGIPVGDLSMLVTILSGAATLFIGYLHWQERHNHPLIVNGLGLILGGAIGNLIDRSRIFFVESYEGVVDFIDIGFTGFRWYTFNVADSAVTIGVILYLLHSLFLRKPELVEQID